MLWELGSFCSLFCTFHLPHFFSFDLLYILRFGLLFVLSDSNQQGSEWSFFFFNPHYVTCGFLPQFRNQLYIPIMKLNLGKFWWFSPCQVHGTNASWDKICNNCHSYFVLRLSNSTWKFPTGFILGRSYLIQRPKYKRSIWFKSFGLSCLMTLGWLELKL